jgi:NTP pyrophosphatase (non-canonical NTP hydrolase)
MKEEERLELYRQAIDKWGKQGQLMMAIEEMAELTQLILHYFRSNRKVTHEQMASEIADVRIMTDQMIEMFSIYDLVQSAENQKLERLKRYIAD